MNNEKVNGLVLKNFHDKDYKELELDFQALIEDYEKKKFGIDLTEVELSFFLNKVIPTIKWKGTEAFGIEAVIKLAKTIQTNENSEIVLVEREHVRAMFHYLNNYEGVGAEDVDAMLSILNNVSLVAKEINEIENDLRDAGFELEAKRQGITPEKLRSDQNAADGALKSAALESVDADDEGLDLN